jgi:uncharacterized membrane protein
VDEVGLGLNEAQDESPRDVAWEDEGTWAVRTPTRWWGWAAFVLSLGGFGDSLYLTIDHFRGTIPICSSTGVIDCAKVTTSPQSEVFGVLPVALLGLLFYTALVVVNVPVLWQRVDRLGHLLSYGRLALAVGGMGMVLYLVYTELFTIKAICLWCTGVHAVTFLLFVLVVTTFPAISGITAAFEE